MSLRLRELLLMYLLDTNTCVVLLNGNRNVELRFAREFPQCYTSTLVVAELYKGVYNSQRVAENLQHLAQFTDLLTVEPFDRAAAKEFGKIQAELRQMYRMTGVMDVLIAAVARSRNSVVVTNNLRDFEHIPKLTVEDWIG